MVIFAGSAPRPHAPWEAGHFVGGHPVLDLTNTVFSRLRPVPDNDLLQTPADVLSWCKSVGLFGKAPRVADERELISGVRAVREDAWAVFDAVARGTSVPVERMGSLLQRAGAAARYVDCLDAERVDVKWTAAEEVPGVLALLAVQAYFTLPTDRVRSCDRCGWMFLDSSRGGRRRWCSMATCGNREKASRHRHAVS